MNFTGSYVYGGKIDSFDTALLPHVSGIPDPDLDEFPGPFEFWMQFISGKQCENEPCGQLDKGVYLFGGEGKYIGTGYTGRLGEIPWAGLPVPEPGTISLILGALGGGWLARRRRKERYRNRIDVPSA